MSFSSIKRVFFVYTLPFAYMASLDLFPFARVCACPADVPCMSLFCPLFDTLYRGTEGNTKQEQRFSKQKQHEKRVSRVCFVLFLSPTGNKGPVSFSARKQAGNKPRGPRIRFHGFAMGFPAINAKSENRRNFCGKLQLVLECPLILC